jgi:hypothetical protein
MDAQRFDRWLRGLTRGTTRRGTLTGLLAGLLFPVLPEATTDAQRHGQGAMHSERKTCKLLYRRCTFKKGNKQRVACVDTRSDPDHCGGCGNRCAAGQTCKEKVCI